VKTALMNAIRRIDWMTPETKKKATEKSKSMIRKMGYPDYLDDPLFVDDYYKNFKVDHDNFFENNLQWVQELAVQQANKMQEKRDRNKWRTENVANVSEIMNVRR
jgi:membrane metallo-endopeptidase-like protein 1